MTPQEKARELVDSFKPYSDWNGFDLQRELLNAKQCVLIAVNEMIHYLEIVLGVDKLDFEYWQEVKEEINKL
jgi:hypothetical protein